MLSIFSISCQSTKTNEIDVNTAQYDFPVLYNEEDVDVSTSENGDVTVTSKADGSVVFYFNNSSKMVAVPLWYWKKIIRYGVNTGGELPTP